MKPKKRINTSELTGAPQKNIVIALQKHKRRTGLTEETLAEEIDVGLPWLSAFIKDIQADCGYAKVQKVVRYLHSARLAD